MEIVVKRAWSQIRRCSLYAAINKNTVPQMYIAKYENEVVRVVSIWLNDLKTRQDLFLWMATLYVKEK